jgi:hypothetical protein
VRIADPPPGQQIIAIKVSPYSRNVACGIEIERHLPLRKQHLFFDNGLEQVALVGKVDIERALGDAGGARNLAHAGAIETQIHEHPAGSIENLAALRAFLVGDQVKGGAMGCNHWFRLSGKSPPPETLRKGLPAYVPPIKYIDRTVRSMIIVLDQNKKNRLQPFCIAKLYSGRP